MYQASAALLFLALFPGFAAAAADEPLAVAPWSLAPFVLLLLSIALLPLLTDRFWHSNLRKALLVAGLSMPVVVYLGTRRFGLEKIGHALVDYAEFIILLASLYTVSGGIALKGTMKPTPWVNTGFLAFGAVL